MNIDYQTRRANQFSRWHRKGVIQANSLPPTHEGLVAEQTARQICSRRHEFTHVSQGVVLQHAQHLDSRFGGGSFASGARFARERAQFERQLPLTGFFNESSCFQETNHFLANRYSSKPHKLRGILDAFVNTCRRWGLDEDDQAVLLGFNSGDVVGRQMLTGCILALSRDVEDRVGYVIAISLGLGILFNERVDAENQWLKLPRKSLHDQSPLDCILNGKMESLLKVNRMVERERGL